MSIAVEDKPHAICQVLGEEALGIFPTKRSHCQLLWQLPEHVCHKSCPRTHTESQLAGLEARPL